MAAQKRGTKGKDKKSSRRRTRADKSSRAPKVKTIRQKQYFPATPEEVFEALVNAKQHAAFTGAKATGIAKAGNKFTAWDGFISGKHLKLDPGKYIRQEWSTSIWPKDIPPSILEFTLDKKNQGTELAMVHTGVPAEQVERYRRGWPKSYWRPLKAYFAKSYR